MNKVTLYQVSKTEQLVSGDHLELQHYTYDKITPIRGSDEFIIEDVQNKIERLPVQKFVFCQKDWKTGGTTCNSVYACFTDELLELIQCERGKFKNLNDELVCKVAQIEDLKRTVKFFESENLRLEDQALHLKVKVCRIEQMGFWKRLVYLFKGGSL